MTNAKRWLDELPLGSSERELLLAGKSARSAAGTIDAHWQALRVVLSTTAATSAGATSAGVASSALSGSASAKVGAAAAASQAAGAGLLVTIGKSLTVGVVVGLVAMGAGSLAQHSLTNDAPAKTPSNADRSPSAHSLAPRAVPQTALVPASEPETALPAPAESVALTPKTSAPSALPSSSREHAANAAQNRANLPPPTAAEQVGSAADKTASLSQQARELAELKRLIDSGSAPEALRRLEQSLGTGAASVLSEERDALYVQALARVQRREEARTFARRFMARYPRSPYFEAMRQLLSDQ